MNSTQYSAKRDELITILTAVLQTDNLNPIKKKEFKEMLRKCQEDQFNITLVGEFQGGKSTTFNAFCDGREISPRGAMVKTSACRLTARNLADQDMKEHSIITWKSDQDLLLSMDDILTSNIDITTDLGIEFEPGDQIVTLDEVLSFRNPMHFSLIKNALAREWNKYEANRSGYTPERLDILRIASLIVRFVNDSDLAVYLKNDRYSVENIAKLMVFPQDWEQRWTKGIDANFTVTESMFAFIASIDCYIHSQNLSRLACSITDCPGLFASKWDTKVAIDTIPKADAIIYLLRGDRAIGSEDIKALREVQKMPAAMKKLFFAINMKTSRAIIENQIIPEDVGKINSIGMEIKSAGIKRYHALLAFMGQLGNAYLEGTLEPTSQVIFKDLAKRMLGDEISLESSWTLLSNQQLITTMNPPQLIDGLTKDSVQKVLEQSGFKDLFDGIEEFIIKHKAYSILITNGAEKAAAELTSISNTLKNREDEATQNVEGRIKELHKANTTLKTFQAEARLLVQEGFPELVYDSLVNDFFAEVIIESAEEISVKIAFRLGQKLTAGVGATLFIDSIFNKPARNEYLAKMSAPIYKEVMKEVILRRAKVWLIAIARGENPKYKATIVNESDRIIQALIARWKELSHLEINISELEYPDITQLVDQVVLQASPINDSLNSDMFYSLAKWELFSSILQFVWDSPKLFWNWLVDILKGWVDFSKVDIDDNKPVERNPQTPEDLDYRSRQMQPNILTSINNASSDPATSKEIKKNILNSLLAIGNLFKSKCYEALDSQRKVFEADYKASEINLKKSTDERMAVANEARRLRETQIDPCNEQINEFLDSTVKLFNTDSNE